MRKNNKGSITVEAAIVVPVFFFALLVFLYLFQVILFQMQLQGGLTEASRELSGLAYVSENKKEGTGESKSSSILQSNILARNIVIENEVKKFFPMEKKYKGILKGKVSYCFSSYLADDETIDLISEYAVSVPVPLFHLAELPVIQRVRTRAFTGTDKLLFIDNKNSTGESKEQYVYITETGTVYHRTLSCSALNLKISVSNMSEVGSLRNSSGGKYKPCEKCCKNLKEGSVVYICEDGDAYHANIECSGLKRTIRKVPLSQVKGEMRECKRCGS